jgi:hypothetical protein
MSGRRGTAVPAALVALAALAIVGCGRDDFANDPRPPVPAEITVKIDNREVLISPSEFGAGLVNFTIANLSDEAATLALEGPTAAESDVIPPGGNAELKAEMEAGGYVALADGPPDVEPFGFEVGPDRPSGQDDLLLP